MSSVLLFVLVTLGWFLIEAIIGVFLGLKKPYNVVLLVIHSVLTIFVIAGVISAIFGLLAVDFGKVGSTISLYVASVAVLMLIVDGIRLATLKTEVPAVVLAHKISAFLLAISLIASIVFIIAKI
ncbi:MAG: hypothetical protein WCJ46_04940 [bacterium]